MIGPLSIMWGAFARDDMLSHLTDPDRDSRADKAVLEIMDELDKVSPMFIAQGDNVFIVT